MVSGKIAPSTPPMAPKLIAAMNAVSERFHSESEAVYQGLRLRNNKNKTSSNPEVRHTNPCGDRSAVLCSSVF
jgi:hypothetical protein